MAGVVRLSNKPLYEIALAIVRRDDVYLVARRPHDVHLPDVWEFPGGKREPGESGEQAACREALEECGVTARATGSLEPIRVEFADRVVELHPVLCDHVAGDAAPLASQECRWVTLAQLAALDMPAPNAPILAALRARARLSSR